jgi:hypothetical protein
MVLKVIIAWVVLMLFILIIAWVVKRIDRNKIIDDGKLDFVDWYWKDKAEILERVQRNSNINGLDIEAELDKEYELYLKE